MGNSSAGRGSLLFAGFVCGLTFGQPVFEVASVKPAVIPTGARLFFGPPQGGPGTADPGQITWTYALLIDMVRAAYDLKSYQVRGPDWISTERYNVAAKVPEGATKEQVRAMWQNLLAERFGLVLHHEEKEFQVEELVIAKGGLKLKETTLEDSNADGPPKMNNGVLVGPGFVTFIMAGSAGPSARVTARAQNLARLTAMLTSQLNRPVIDKTGLTGKYDFNLEYTPNLPPGQLPPSGTPATDAGASEPGLGIGDALERQLGLKLVANKTRLDVVVVDKAQIVPSAN